MLFRQLAVAATGSLALGAFASPLAAAHHTGLAPHKREVPATHVLHERQLAHWGRQWTKRDKVPARALLPMRIGLVQRNLEAGAKRLREM